MNFDKKLNQSEEIKMSSKKFILTIKTLFRNTVKKTLYWKTWGSLQIYMKATIFHI